MSDEMYIKRARQRINMADAALESLKNPPAQGETFDIPHYPYLANLPRNVSIKGELHVTEYGLQELEAIAREAMKQQDELTEICQLFGYPLYVRLDWRNPEQAKEMCERIRFTIKEAFERAGWITPSEDANAKEQKWQE